MTTENIKKAPELDADGQLELVSTRRKLLALNKNTQSYYASIDSAFKQLDEILKK